MNATNLMPRTRLAALRRSDRLRAWVMGLSAYSAVLLLGWAVAGKIATASAEGVARMVRDARVQAETGEAAVKKLRGEVAGLSARAGAARAIADHPDWSVLLGLVAGLRGDEIVLGTVDLSAGPGGAPGRPSGYTLLLAGSARSHQSVTQFALRLESTGLFERVTIGDTRVQEHEGGSQVAFQVRCTLTEVGKGGA